MQFDTGLLNQVVAEHIFRTGQVAVGEKFLIESQTPMAEKDKKQFEALNTILQERGFDVDSALSWTSQNQSKLAGIQSSVHFKLHKLKYLNLLKEAVKIWQTILDL